MISSEATRPVEPVRARPPRRLNARARRAVLTAHIVVSVGLLGEVAGFLAVAVRAGGSDDPAFAHTAYDLMATFQFVFGIPLSFLALGTGLTLGLSTKWGASLAVYKPGRRRRRPRG